MLLTRWSPHPGYQGVLISDDGRALDLWKPEILPFDLSHHGGYVRVSLRGKTRYIHHLVLETFVGPRPSGCNGLHADDVRANNHLANLRWGTQSENMLDASANGLLWQTKKTHCPKQHEYTEANTYRHRDGRRECLTCKRAKRNVARDRRVA